MNAHRKTRGFTLIELMITVAIIGLLAAIAYPTYISQVRQSRRTDAVSLLMRAANRQERVYTTNYTYADDMTTDLGLPTTTENGWYTISIAADATSFTITASAQGDQQEDTCDSFSINQLGEKMANGMPPSAAISQECW